MQLHYVVYVYMYTIMLQPLQFHLISMLEAYCDPGHCVDVYYNQVSENEVYSFR